MAAVQSLSAGPTAGLTAAAAQNLDSSLTTDLPQFAQQPVDQTVSPGGTATFAVTPEGTPEPTVQWQESSDNGLSYTDVAGATAPVLTVSPAAVAATPQADRYRAVITNEAGSDTSASARLVVVP
jgi:hypothetical protein